MSTDASSNYNILYGYGSWFLTLSEKNKLMVFVNRDLKRIFALWRGEWERKK
jgi:hypothetical protein